MWMFVHLTQLVLPYGTLSNEIFLTENLIILCCAWNNSKKNFFPQPQEKKRGNRQTQCSSRLCECLCTWPSWCYPMERFQMRFFAVHFDWKSCCLCACYKSKMDSILEPQHQKSGRRHTQCFSPLLECLCTWPSWCCPMEPFHMRYFVVHFDWKSCYFVRGTTEQQQNEF